MYYTFYGHTLHYNLIGPTLSDIVQSHVPLSMALAQLNQTIENIPSAYRLVITHILLATKLCITRMWKSKRVPFIEETFELVNTHCSYEIMMASNRGTVYTTKPTPHGKSGQNGLTQHYT